MLAIYCDQNDQNSHRARKFTEVKFTLHQKWILDRETSVFQKTSKGYPASLVEKWIAKSSKKTETILKDWRRNWGYSNFLYPPLSEVH